MAADLSTSEKQTFKTGDVCSIAGIQPFILRSWEAEFPALAQTGTKGGARVYRRADVELVLRIKALVFEEGLTLGAARRKLSGVEDEVSNDDRRGETGASRDSGSVDRGCRRSGTC